MPARVPGPTGSIFLSTPGPTGWRDHASPLSLGGLGAPQSDGSVKRFPFGMDSLDDALLGDPSHLYQSTPLGYLANSVANNAQSLPNLHSYSIWTESGAVLFRVKTLAIDIDGAPDAYHPPVYPSFLAWQGPKPGARLVDERCGELQVAQCGLCSRG